MSPAPLVLASASPRRAALLEQIGLSALVHPSRVLEHIDAGLSAREVVAVLSRQKAEAVAPEHADAWVIAADTMVVHGSKIMGQPASDEDAKRMLRLLSGKTHHVHTGVCVIAPARGDARDRHEGVAEADVTFHDLSDAQIGAYVATGEPVGKAGAYAIQGRAGVFVRELRGDYSAVVGLPLRLSVDLLERARFPLPPHLRFPGSKPSLRAMASSRDVGGNRCTRSAGEGGSTWTATSEKRSYPTS